MKNNAFTLMELMLTVIVIAILVSIAIPNYINTLERARAREARATLASIVAAEQTYDAERRTTWTLNPGTDADWNAIGLDNPNNNARGSWDYTFTDPTATASRRSGPYQGQTITLDMNGNEAGSWSP